MNTLDPLGPIVAVDRELVPRFGEKRIPLDSLLQQPDPLTCLTNNKMYHRHFIQQGRMLRSVPQCIAECGERCVSFSLGQQGSGLSDCHKLDRTGRSVGVITYRLRQSLDLGPLFGVNGQRQLKPGALGDNHALERTIDQYGYIALAGNYYWVPGTKRDDVRVLEYADHLKIFRRRELLIEYPLPPDGVKNKAFSPEGHPKPRHQPKNRRKPTTEEEKRLRALADEVGAYLDFVLKTGRVQRHRLGKRSPRQVDQFK